VLDSSLSSMRRWVVGPVSTERLDVRARRAPAHPRSGVPAVGNDETGVVIDVTVHDVGPPETGFDLS